MMRFVILLLLIPSVASAQTYIARPVAEDCSLAKMGPDETFTINWACVEVYAARKDWQVADWHQQALLMKAIRDGKAK